MSDSNFTYLEAAKRRKKKNQIISILIIFAVVLVGVAIWGVVEIRKNEAAERIKNALSSQEYPTIPDSTSISTQTGTTADSIVSSTESPVEKNREPIQEIAKTPLEKPLAKVEVKHPVAPSKRVEPKVKPEPTPKKITEKIPEATKPVVVKEQEVIPKTEEKSVITQPKTEEKPIDVKPLVKTEVKPEMKSETSTAIVPEVKKVTEVPKNTANAFEPEDFPIAANTTPSEDTKLAMNTIVKTGEITSNSSTGSSDFFKQGMAAYKQNDYANATRLFAQIPAPATKRRGDPTRDEFVQGNFLRGVALLRTNHTSEAVTAFQSVLGFEKYFPLANMNLGICYVDMKQYGKAHRAFEAVVRDQNYVEPAMFDDVMQRTKYFWALAWTRLYKSSKDADKQSYFRQQSILRWKDYQVWFGKNDKYRAENQKADDYLKSLTSL